MHVRRIFGLILKIENRNSPSQNVWPALSACLLLTLASKGLLIGVPVLLKLVLDSLQNNLFHAALALIVAYAFARFGSELLQELKNWIFVPSMAQYANLLTQTVHDHLFCLPLRFHLNRKSGALVRVLDRGGDAVHTLATQIVFHVIPKIIELCLTIALLLFSYGVIPPAIVASMILVYMGATFKLTNRRIKIKAEMDATKSSISALAAESINNFEIVKSLRTEAVRSRALEQALAKSASHATKWERNLVVINVVQAFIIALGIGGSLAYSAMQASLGHYTIGDFVLINSLTIQITSQLSNAASMYRNVVDSVSDIEAAMSVLDIEGEIRTQRGDAGAMISHSVEFRSVSFSYGEDRRTLDSISISVPSGSKLAIVGPTGSGKTTLIRMLTGLVSPESGAIEIGGKSLALFPHSQLGRVLSVVPQDVTLFSGSILENIVAGVDVFSDEDLQAAVDAAQLGPLLRRLPEGLNTSIGERGLKLSGGERQRVALARALIRRSSIVVLDEATSALDTRTEAEIKEALLKITGVTLIVIAHRLTSIAAFDQIAVLDRGKLVESGTHRQLMDRDGIYRSMWNRQASEVAIRPLDVESSA